MQLAHVIYATCQRGRRSICARWKPQPCMTDNDRLRRNAHGPLATLDRTLGRLVAAASILVLPVSLLLFLQWPLREWLLAYSREANDLAQVLFALYVSVAITAATRHRR